MTNLIEIRISERGSFAQDHSFGATGPYERLVGRAHFAVDPRVAAQAGITDLDKAPVDAQGQVRFAADIMILKPKDMARGNRRLFLDYHLVPGLYAPNGCMAASGSALNWLAANLRLEPDAENRRPGLVRQQRHPSARV